MTRDRKAAILTALILTGAIGLVALKRSGWQAPSAAILRSRPPATPQDTVYRMLDSARDGNVGAYLGCYTGAMADSLRQLVKEKGESSLSDYIRNFNASIKGVALQEPESISENQVRERIEFVYGDRNESQIYYLQRTGGGWKIASQENAQGVKAVFPYGTPVE